MYEKPPFFLNFLIYVFNVTNKDDVVNGSELNYAVFLSREINWWNISNIFLSKEKPKFEEIGPYFFEWDLNVFCA